MKKYGTFQAVFLVLAMMISMVVGGTAVDAAPATTEKGTYHLVVSHGTGPEGSIAHLYGEKFRELIEKKSNGKITSEAFVDGQKFYYDALLPKLQDGSISVMIFQPAPALKFIPELALLDLPYAFYGCDKDDVGTVLNDSYFSKYLDNASQKAGFKVLGMAQAGGFREVSSNKEIRSAADFKGLKLRVLDNKYHKAFWGNLGADLTFTPFGKLYDALKSGTVDAQENPYDTMNAGRFAEVQKYIVHTHHIGYANIFLANNDLYQSLPAELKTAFDEAALEARLYAENLMAESANKDLKALTDKGMTLIELPKAEMFKMKKAASVVEPMLRQDLGDAAVDIFLDAIKAATEKQKTAA